MTRTTAMPFDLPHPDPDAEFYEGVPTKRAVAWVIDFVICLVAAAALTLVVGIMTIGVGFLFFPGILFLIAFFYRFTTIASGSATWGMAFTGIELRDRSGRRLDPLTAALHTGIFMFLMASIIGWAATVAAILLTRYHQGIPDLLLGTTAINRPAF